jgi:sugar O-acyltransferase (sialic acid O-acetyltransferase NeuD family)
MHIIGASGHAKVIIDILHENEVSIDGIWDENPDVKVLSGYDVLGNFNDFSQVKTDEVIIAIGKNATRKKVAGELPYGSRALAIHPRTNISKTAKIREGSVIMAGVSINTDVKIGKYAIINTSATVDHDCVIGDFVHISPGVNLAGDVLVGDGTQIGIGSCVIQGIRIGKWATIGAGTVIIRDVPDFAVVVGNPGRIIKYNTI